MDDKSVDKKRFAHPFEALDGCGSFTVRVLQGAGVSVQAARAREKRKRLGTGQRQTVAEHGVRGGAEGGGKGSVCTL